MTKIDLLITNIGSCLTLAGPARVRVGHELREVGEIREAAIAISDGRIVAIGSEKQVREQLQGADIFDILDAQGKLVTPGLVDPHTHLVHAGSREHELALKLAGVSYLEILERGGGILDTVRQTRAATKEQLFLQAKESLDRMLLHGTTTIEAKSGYGLNLETEIMQLEVAHLLDQHHPIDIVHTFMGAHAIPEEYQNRALFYTDYIVTVVIPQIASLNLAEFCDVFCEQGVFSVDFSRRVLTAAKEYGMKLKIHADEIEAIGGAQLAAEMGCISAEHLMATDEKGIKALTEAGVIGVLLPATSFNLATGKYAPARKMIEAGMGIALATDYNPGSSPTESMQIVQTIACLYLRMTPNEVLTATTINAAYAIDRGDEIGSLEVGKKADIVLWNCKNFDYIPYHFGINHVNTVIKNGKIVVRNSLKTFF